MTTLFDKFSKVTADKLSGVFEELNLPIPHRGEYHRWDSTVVFLNPFGLALRLQPRKKMPLLRHEHLLRPLGSIIVDEKLRIDITQGGKTATKEEQSRAVHKKLKADRILTDDIKHKPQNSLILRAVNIEFPEGIPVAYDPYKLKTYNRSIREFKDVIHSSNVIDMLPTAEEEQDAQDTLFGELRAQFQDCVTPNSGQIDPNKLTEFYQSCRQYKKAGLLLAPWESGLKTPFSLARKSAKYALRMEKHASLLAHDPEI